MHCTTDNKEVTVQVAVLVAVLVAEQSVTYLCLRAHKHLHDVAGRVYQQNDVLRCHRHTHRRAQGVQTKVRALSGEMP